MGMTVIEKILATHAGKAEIAPGDIVDVIIDARVARDFGGANVVNHMEEHHLKECFECGACSYVCPSHIPLVQQFRSAKAFIKKNRAA